MQLLVCLHVLLLLLVEPELVEAGLERVAPVSPELPEQGPGLAPQLLLGHGVDLQVLEHPRLDGDALDLKVSGYEFPLGEDLGQVLLEGETLGEAVHEQAEGAGEGGLLPGGEGTAQGSAVLCQ